MRHSRLFVAHPSAYHHIAARHRPERRRVGRLLWRRVPLWVAVVAAILALRGPLPSAHAAHTATLPPPSQIVLLPSKAGPQPVGTRLTWYALARDSVPLVYQFRVAYSVGGPYTVVRDFSSHLSFVWTPLQEGLYAIQVSVKEGYTGTATVSKTALYAVTSRVSGSQAVITATVNPLVALYSAPPCTSGQIMVAFHAVGSQTWTDTNVQPCRTGLSRNFLVAGMAARTAYVMANVILNAGTTVTSTASLFITGSPPRSIAFPTTSVPLPPSAGSDTAASLIFHELAATSGGANPLATDLSGRVVWYTDQTDLRNTYPLRIEPVGGPLGDEIVLAGSDLSNGTDDVLRVVDLAGNPVQETNAQVINQQLAAQGQRIIYGFGHDALVLPNGDVATLGFTERTITTTAVMGDMLLVLDRNLQVVWTWDAFQHLDPNRGPTLGDTCGQAYISCPVPTGASTIDWTHTNAIDYTPLDGNLILSVRNQDWVIKIDYANGTGDGHVLWRLGPGGDFSIVPLNPADPYPWFSHQHDANFVDGAMLTVFDNGNTRCAGSTGSCNSRGQTYIVDEQTMVVTQTVNADLGSYSYVLGTAQRLSNGNFNFTVGLQTFPPPVFGLEIEVLPNGTQVYVQRINDPEYRAWRLESLYSSTNPACPSCGSGG